MKIGDFVKEKEYTSEGIISEIYNNWDELKEKSYFTTLDPNPEESDYIERLINGDPKDKWLELQDIAFTDEQLAERWFTIKHPFGGTSWTCESRIELLQ